MAREEAIRVLQDTHRGSFYSPGDFLYTPASVPCLFCGLLLADIIPFKRRNASRGVSFYCHHCKTRAFFNTPDAAIVAEAYSRLITDPEHGEAMRTALLVMVEKIKAEKGMPGQV